MKAARCFALLVTLLFCFVLASGLSRSSLRHLRRRFRHKANEIVTLKSVNFCPSQNGEACDYQTTSLEIDTKAHTISAAGQTDKWEYTGEVDGDGVDETLRSVAVVTSTPDLSLRLEFLTDPDFETFMTAVLPHLHPVDDVLKGQLDALDETLEGITGIEAVYTQPTEKEGEVDSFRLVVDMRETEIDSDKAFNKLISDLLDKGVDADIIENTQFIYSTKSKRLSGWVTDMLGGKNMASLVGGISIGPTTEASHGTLGGFLIPTQIDAKDGHQLYVLTNHHVLEMKDGSAACQPGIPAWQDLHKDCGKACCQRMGDKYLDLELYDAKGNEQKDAMDIALVPVDYKARHRIKCAVKGKDGDVMIKGRGAPEAGTEVWKFGARTHYTKGVISETPKSNMPKHYFQIDGTSYPIFTGVETSAGSWAPPKNDLKLWDKVQDEVVAELENIPFMKSKADQVYNTLATAKQIFVFGFSGDSGSFILDEQNQVLGVLTESGWDFVYSVDFRDNQQQPWKSITAARTWVWAHPIDLVLDKINAKLKKMKKKFELDVCTSDNRPPPPADDRGCHLTSSGCQPAPYCKKRTKFTTMDFCRLRRDVFVDDAQYTQKSSA